MTDLRITTLLFALALASPAAAGTVPEYQRGGIDARRTTLLVRDIDASLKVHRDAPGMQVIHGNRVPAPRDTSSVEAADRAVRPAFMRANDNYAGIPDAPRFNTKELDLRFEQAGRMVGANVAGGREVIEYPAYGGDGVIRVRASTITGPDAFIVELNKLPGGLR